LGAAAVALIVLIVFAGVFSLDFVAFDDFEAIVSRPEFNPPTAASFGRIWGLHYSELYTPLLWVGWWLLAFLGRGEDGSWSAAPYHSFNLLAHACAAVKAFLDLRRLIRTDNCRGVWPAAIGALAFAVHPLQVESVAWVSGMKTPLSGFLALWACWHYLAFADRWTNAEVTRRRGGTIAHTIAATLLFFLALLAKPTVVVMPLMLGLFDRILRRRPWRVILVGLAPWLVMAAACSLLNARLQTATAVTPLPLYQRSLIALDSLGFYVRKFCLPFPLVPDYARTPQWVIGSSATAYGCIPAVAALILTALFWRRAPWAIAGVAAFMLGAAATSGLQPFDYQVYSTVADRYAYLSLIGAGLFMACAVRAGMLRWGTRPVVSAACAMLLVWSGLTLAQVPKWRDTYTLGEHTLRYTPNSMAAYRSLVTIAARDQKPELIMAYCKEGLRACPGDPKLLQWQGNIDLALQRPTEAASAFREALKTAKVDREQLLMGLAQALAQSQQFDEAERTFKEAIAANSSYAPAHENLGVMYFQRGQFNAAEAEFTAALQLDPNSTTSKKGLVEVRRRQGGPT
jgi:cytochrome c-type biogenesis protein CcmH/NrfG